MKNAKLPALLRAMASGKTAKAVQHDVILEAAADEIEMYRSREPLHAHSMGCTRCSDPMCNQAHIALFNEDDDVLATAVLDASVVAQLIGWYEATENGTRQ
jgi:uncharacterized protein (DUF779 family)